MPVCAAAQWALSKNCEKWIFFNLNVIRCINQRFGFKNSGIWCLAFDILPEQSEIAQNDNPACKSCSGLRETTFIYCFNRYKPMAQWWRRITESQAIWVQFWLGDETLSCLFAILCDTKAVFTLTHALLYCCTLYNFFFLDLVNGDLALTGV